MDFSKLYKEYKNKMDTAMAKQKAKNRPFWDEAATGQPHYYSKNEFEVHFKAKWADMKADGKKVTETRVVNELVEGHTYGYSAKQAASLKRALQARELDITISEARSWGGQLKEAFQDGLPIPKGAPESLVELYKDIKARADKLRADGLKSDEIEAMIGHEFFGSE